MAQSEIIFYHAPQSRSLIAHWMLEEVGAPYRFHLLSFKKGDLKKPDYQSVNPMGKVPAIKHGNVVVTEAAAICAYLADAFPQTKLAPPPGDPSRGPYYRWLFFAPSCLEPAIVDKMLKRQPDASPALGWGDFDTAVSAVAQAVSQARYIAGDQFSAADVVVGSTVRWGMAVKVLPERREFVDYVARLSDRPALKRMTEQDAELVAAQSKD
jgi:glutathione S-transferase